MKKRILSFLIAGMALTSLPAFSQTIEVHNGAQFQVTSLESVETIIDVSEQGTSFLTRAGFIANKFRVLNLDGQLNELSKFEIEVPEVNGKKLKYFWSVKLGNSVYFMSRYFDRKADEYTLYASQLDPTNGQFKQHFEAVKVVDKKFGSLSNPFAAVRSVDSTKVLFITEYPTSGSENARYGLKVVKDDMSTVWAKDIEFPHQDKDFSVLDYDVDRNGNIHFTAAIRMDWDEKNDKDSRGRYYITIYSYFHETGELKQYEIGFTQEIIRSIDLVINEKNELVGTGFYSEKKLADSYKGFFFLRINPETKEVVAKTLTPFSQELLAQLIGERKAEKGKELPAYEIRRTLPLPNGGMAVVAEHYVYQRTESTNSSGQTTTYETWLFGNVVTMFIDADGKMQTAGVLKKKQLCTAKNGNATLMQQMGIGMYPGVNELPYYGIGILEHNGNIMILYNENPKNAERVAAGKNPLSVRQKTSVTQLVTFTPDGNVSSDVLFKSKDKEAGYSMPLMPRSSIQYASNSMVVFGRKGKNMRVSRLTVN
ncbi:MAG: hypothetical protein IPM74_14965 [Crocinitomicaceae bacterium]|nr:hypothetical protein [Crocinitomicaceae bacterium]MBK8927172.1 hypothetical protein [Crocinitomicaceae bacterium]